MTLTERPLHFDHNYRNMKWTSFSFHTNRPPNPDEGYDKMKWTSFSKFLTDHLPNFDHKHHNKKRLATKQGRNLARRVEYARTQIIL